jgi:hypothetical protein
MSNRGSRVGVTRKMAAEQRAAANNAQFAPDSPFRTVDARGGVLMVLMPDELDAVREHWDRRDRVRRLLGKGHG